MSTTNFRIIKQCEHCGNMFEAQKRTTRFCSHKCNSRNYKLRKRLETKKEIEAEIPKIKKLRPKVKALDIEMIRNKEFLTVSEVSVLFGCSRKTVYRMIRVNKIEAINLKDRLTRIRREDIEALFEMPKKQAPDKLTVDDCYTMEQIRNKYKVARDTVYGFHKKYNIQRLKQEGITYYSKTDIDNIFSI